MIELRGEKVVLRALEREHCHQLWEHYVPAEPLPTEPLNPGLSVEGAADRARIRAQAVYPVSMRKDHRER